jgi:acetyl-CoA carboxylase carboxyl transferase subunit beta
LKRRAGHRLPAEGRAAVNWLKRAKQGIKTWRKKSLPDGLWEKCPSCGEILYKKEILRLLSVCPRCDYHFRINYSSYIEIAADPGSFKEMDADLVSIDPLEFKDGRRYADRIAEACAKTGLNSAIITGTAAVNRRPVALGIMDFGFLGGSMDSVVGEKIARLARKAVEDRLPLIIVSASGGARMQESVLSLMQMAKTSAAIAKVSDVGLPYISVLTNPTTGGVSASFAFQGDIIIAEPKALIGFAGPRVIHETVGEKLPEGFQRSEFLLEHGMIDMICSRSELRGVLDFLLESLTFASEMKTEEESRENVRAKMYLIK